MSNCFCINQLVRQIVLGCWPLGHKVAKNAFSWHPFGEHLVCSLFERHIGTLPPKKVPKQKTCQILRKRVICDYLLLNCIAAKKIRNFEFNNNKNDLHHEKEHTKLHIRHLNSFFNLRIVFELFWLQI